MRKAAIDSVRSVCMLPFLQGARERTCATCWGERAAHACASRPHETKRKKQRNHRVLDHIHIQEEQGYAVLYSDRRGPRWIEEIKSTTDRNTSSSSVVELSCACHLFIGRKRRVGPRGPRGVRPYSTARGAMLFFAVFPQTPCIIVLLKTSQPRSADA